MWDETDRTASEQYFPGDAPPLGHTENSSRRYVGTRNLIFENIHRWFLSGNVEAGYKDFMNSLKDKVNVIVTFDRSHKITTIHLFKKF